jgi:hypothetical protein
MFTLSNVRSCPAVNFAYWTSKIVEANKEVVKFENWDQGLSTSWKARMSFEKAYDAMLYAMGSRIAQKHLKKVK